MRKMLGISGDDEEHPAKSNAAISISYVHQA